MSRNMIEVKNAKAIGPYSVAVDAGELIFLSGQIPLNAEGKLVDGGIVPQTNQCFANVFNALESAGLDESAVQKVIVYLKDMKDFAAMNDVYKDKFTQPYPVRTAIAVLDLPAGAMVEIEVIAKK